VPVATGLALNGIGPRGSEASHAIGHLGGGTLSRLHPVDFIVRKAARPQPHASPSGGSQV
jgi:hypothetical protein